MNRDELIEAGTRAVKDRYYGTVADGTTEGLIRQDVAVTVDAVEPLIRADERELITDVLMRATEEGMVQALREWKADLRAHVEALRSHHPTELVDYQWNLALSKALALIDGGGDA